MDKSSSLEDLTIDSRLERTDGEERTRPRDQRRKSSFTNFFFLDWEKRRWTNKPPPRLGKNHARRVVIRFPSVNVSTAGPANGGTLESRRRPESSVDGLSSFQTPSYSLPVAHLLLGAKQQKQSRRHGQISRPETTHTQTHLHTTKKELKKNMVLQYLNIELECFSCEESNGDVASCRW